MILPQNSFGESLQANKVRNFPISFRKSHTQVNFLVKVKSTKVCLLLSCFIGESLALLFCILRHKIMTKTKLFD